MLRRFSLGKALAFALLASLPAAACTDEPPTAVGGELFPGGRIPGTFELVLPADSFAQRLGVFSGYSDFRDVAYLLVANRFDGALDAHVLARLADFPTTVTYTRGGTSRTDSIAAFGPGSLLVQVDTVASAASGPLELQVWEVGQEYHPGSATWELAVDTTNARVPWREPGGTRGTLLSRLTLQANARQAGDSLVIPLDSVAVQRIARSGFPGLLITATGAQGRLQTLGTVSLRTGAHPRGAAPDTTIATTVQAAAQIFVHNPDQPTGSTAYEAGGIRSARTLFRVNFPATVPVCRDGTCTRMRLRDVTLNEVALLFRPTPVPGGFRSVAPVQLVVRRVAEPELGARAPLGDPVNDIGGFDVRGGALFAGARLVPTDSVLTIPITSFAARLIQADSTGASLALLADPRLLVGDATAIPFGAAWFQPTPRLRIVYTLPERPVLP